MIGLAFSWGTVALAEPSVAVDCAASATERQAPEIYWGAYLEARAIESAARRALDQSTSRFDDWAARTLVESSGVSFDFGERVQGVERERRLEAAASARVDLCRAAVLERLSAIERSRIAPVSTFLGRWRMSIVGPSSTVVSRLEIVAGGNPSALNATFSLRPEQALGAPPVEATAAGEPVLLVWDEGRFRSQSTIPGWRFDGGFDPTTGMLRGELSVPAGVESGTVAATWTAERLPSHDDIEEEDIEPQ